MTTTRDTTLVFKDQAGDYFLLPQEALERGRVPAEHKAEVERQLADANADDVSGHLVFLMGMVAGALITGAAASGMVAYQMNNRSIYHAIQDGLAEGRQ
jgi:hypothetical protein